MSMDGTGVERFERRRSLGEGRWLAWDEDLAREVEWRSHDDPDAWRRRAAAHHPSLRAVLAVGAGWAALEPVRGEPLRWQDVPPAQGARMLSVLTGAVEAAHAVGLSLGGLVDVRSDGTGLVRVEPGPGSLADDVEALRSAARQVLGEEWLEGIEVNPAGLREALERYLDGGTGRLRAAEALHADEGFAAQQADLERTREQLTEQLGRASDDIPARAAVEERRAVWVLGDRLAEVERTLETLVEDRLERLHAARLHDPELEPLRSRLLDLHRRVHPRDPERHEAEIRALDDGRCARWLEGGGLLTLHTDVPVTVSLHRYVERDRRLHAEFERPLGATPLDEVPLARGSWLLILEAAGRPPVRYPVFIERNAYWHGVPPGGTAPEPVHIPAVGDVGEDEVYVPAGWCLVGTEEAGDRRWLWVDSFVIGRLPTTHAEYGPWALLDPQRVPRGPDASAMYEGTPDRFDVVGLAYGGDHPRAPVFSVRKADAAAFAASQGRRLPGEYEWEKAARGVDGREYPWGSRTDATFAWLRGRREARVDDPDLPPVELLPESDTSPYGVRGLGGGVRSFCVTAPPIDGSVRYDPLESDGGPSVQARGGAWWFHPQQRSGSRVGVDRDHRYVFVGFRMARSV